MEPTSILAKTAKGNDRAKIDGSGLNYDAVRVLRLVDGKASVAELRTKFDDLTDSRYQKAIAALHEKKLVEVLAGQGANAGEAELRKLNEQSQEIAQEVVQTLDFTKLKRGLLDAVQAPPPAAGAAKTPPANAAKPAPAVPQGAPEAKAGAKLDAELRPKIEAELRAQLTAALRPKIEEELRQKLVTALRPVLEAEIRAKLTTALVPRVAHEMRSRLANPGAPADAAAATESGPHTRLLECIRETVFETDLAGNCVYINERWTKISGYSCEESVRKPLAQFFVPEDQSAVTDHLNKVARGETVPIILEARLARKTGDPLRIAMRAASLSEASGSAVGVCGTLRGMS